MGSRIIIGLLIPTSFSDIKPQSTYDLATSGSPGSSLSSTPLHFPLTNPGNSNQKRWTTKSYIRSLILEKYKQPAASQ
ncbi:hypothetical protein CEXT_335811 [Caerostris extrusa]|uniref:Uncharacterized protein n=1 Tax=Caerostris extrusa TaxID=172846 RepID=A0AAV4M3I5_CAEEX|nr:hypothetical protein CEXT_335811 [Caerostris extrusa]